MDGSISSEVTDPNTNVGNNTLHEKKQTTHRLLWKGLWRTISDFSILFFTELHKSWKGRMWVVGLGHMGVLTAVSELLSVSERLFTLCFSVIAFGFCK